MKSIVIKAKDQGKRIDVFLAGKLKSKSRSQFKKMIEAGEFLVNGKIVSGHCGLREGDVIKRHSGALQCAGTSVDEKQKADNRQQATGNPSTPIRLAPLAHGRSGQAGKFRLKDIIVKETKDYLVVNKPAGLVAHGAPHIKELALVDYVLKKYPALKNVGEDKIRPGIVHRLDREASGLMVIAKNQKAFEYFKELFKTRQITKKYSALVYGRVSKDYDEINFPIKRASQGHKMAAVPENYQEAEIDKEAEPTARQAETHFEVAKRFINYTLLKVAIKTGRTHQIRCHMTAYGHPIVGDDLYSTKRTREQNKKIGLNRIFLVANELSFVDMDGEEQGFKIGLPAELKELLERIK